MSSALLAAWAVVFLMNVVPLHLPPAWMQPQDTIAAWGGATPSAVR